MVDPKARPIPVDYDTDPGRSRTEVLEKYGFGGDIHEDVAARITAKRLSPVLDVGCGRGRLIRLLRDLGVAVVGFDASPTMLRAAPGPRVREDAGALPFTDESFQGAAALYMLYHLPDPQVTLAECHRVLKPGGLFVACSPSRHDDPELAPYLPEEPPVTFDAESGPGMIGEHFQDIELDQWDLPYYRLPDREAVVKYLYSRQYSRAVADRVADQVDLPITVTKRGAIIYGYKRK